MRKYLFSILFIFSYCEFPAKKEILRYPNGSVHRIVYYTDFRKPQNCFIKTFYPNGKIYKVVAIENWKYVGEMVIYSPNGKIKEIDSFSVPCNIASKIMHDGLLVLYNKNGTLSRRYTIKNGLQNGLSQYYDTTGKLRFECDLKDGRIRNGIYNVYRPNGILAYSEFYKNDTLTDFQYFFDEFGDSLKYYNTYEGQMDFPYKKWLSLELMLYGDYTDKRGKSVTWRWIDYTGKEIKRKIAFPVKGCFPCPE